MKSFTLAAVLVSLPIIIPYVVAQSTSSGSTVSITSTAVSSSTVNIGRSTTISSSSSGYTPSLSTSSSTSVFAPATSSSTIYILSSTSPYVSSSSVAPVPQPSISPVGNYYFAGCYVEPTTGVRALSFLSAAADNMTIEACSAVCAGTYQYFGLEYSRECWCGNTLSVGTIKTTQDQCNMPCGGASTEMCGAPNTLSLYSSTKPIPIPPAPNSPPTIGPYTFIGCYTEAPNYQRALTSLEIADPNMTNEMCAAACAGYIYFGTEYSNECYCGNTIAVGANATANTDCSMNCAGNSLEACGAALRLNLYANLSPATSPSASASPVPVISSSSSLVKPSPSSLLSSLMVVSSSSSMAKSISSSSLIVLSSSSSVGRGSSIAIVKSSSSPFVGLPTSSIRGLSSTLSARILSSPSTLSSSKPAPIASTSATTPSLSSSTSVKKISSTKSTFLTIASTSSTVIHPSGTWASVGCFQDTAKHNMVAITKGKTMNVEACISAAQAAATAKKPVKYLVIGLENGSSCFGATAAPTATSLVGPAACTMTCAGNKKGASIETCGGKLQYNMYASVTIGGAYVAGFGTGPIATPTPDSDGDYDNNQN